MVNLMNGLLEVVKFLRIPYGLCWLNELKNHYPSIYWWFLFVEECGVP